MNSTKFSIIIIFLLKFFVFTGGVPNYIYKYCQANATYAPNSAYQTNLHNLLSSISPIPKRDNLNGFNNSYGEDPDKVYGLFLCRPDLSSDACQECVTFATIDVLQQCPNKKIAVIWYDDCLVRYSNQSSFSEKIGLYMWNVNNVSASGRVRFNEIVRTSLTETAAAAANGLPSGSTTSAEKEFSYEKIDSKYDKLYTLVQCTPDLSTVDCSTCLQLAIQNLPICCDGKVGGRVLYPSCLFRYEVYRFFNKSRTGGASPSPPVGDPPAPSPPLPPPPGKSRNSSVTIAGIVVAICVSLALSCLAYYCFLTRRASKQDDALLEHKDEIEMTSVESLQFSLGTIEAATNSFSKENKLGQGGFGEVHKGMLVDGQEIAVKRLSRRSTQGAEEFKTEVMLVAKLQHRNLVRLLGFCLEGEEKILVYEFVPNKSLDYFLFDPKKQGQLKWEQRHKIIKGIARGILYLHEDSRLKIIHRDLKSSNILLDKEMNPKISDFGMARIFGVDQAQATTERIVGTYGYMSPEYAMRGEFSVKSDVYSFGVLTLEIITGRKNNSFYQIDGFVDLISYVWKHWIDEKPLEVLDPALADACSRNEVARCIHIGMLCVQEDPSHRPTMASVVMMLNSFAVNLPSPQRPGFFPGRIEYNRHVIGTSSESESKKSSSLWSIDETPITQTYPR